MLVTRVITKIDEFESIKSEWNTLLDKSNSSSVFLTWEWLYTWWEIFHDNKELFLIIVSNSENRIIGIAPFYIHDRWQGLPIRAISFLGTTQISSEYMDIISDPEYEAQVSSAVINTLLNYSKNWDCIILSDSDKCSSVQNFFCNIARENGFRLSENISQECPYLSLTPSQNDTFSKFKPQLRSTIKRRTNKLEKIGFKLSKTTDKTVLAAKMEKLFELHQKCWNARGVKGNFRDNKIRSFHNIVANRFLNRNLLQLYSLQVENQTIASLYAFKYKNKLFYFQSGYDPEWLPFSPGTVLMWKSIDDAINQHLVEFDYLRGTEDYKKLWADNSRKTYTIRLIPPENIKANIIFAIYDLTNSSKQIVKRVMRQFYKFLATKFVGS